MGTNDLTSLKSLLTTTTNRAQATQADRLPIELTASETQSSPDGSVERVPKAYPWERAPKCARCKDKGFLVADVPPGHPDFSKVIPCECKKAEIAEKEAQALRDLSDLGNLSRLTFDTFLADGMGLAPLLQANLRQAHNLCHQYAEEPKGWLVLLGGYGCGKTHLAAAIANRRLALMQPVIFVVVPDLLDHLRQSYRSEAAESIDERLDRLYEAPLLILDDLGAHHATPWAQEKLFQIINHRYNNCMPTVVTANGRLEEIEPRVSSRLSDHDLSMVYEILAPDFRRLGTKIGDNTLSTLALHREHTFATLHERAELCEAGRHSLQIAVQRARAYAEQPENWLVFSGGYGTGKTHLAAAIANYQVEQGRLTPMFVVAPDLLDHLRATFNPNSATTLDKVFDQVRSAPLLVLDDLGTESATPWATEKLFQLLNYRYVSRQPTVITTSRVVNEIDARLRSRMLDSEHCQFIALDLPSYTGTTTLIPQEDLSRLSIKSQVRRR